MRAFVAIELPEGPRGRLGERIETGREHLPKARWVSSRGLHLTLFFLGETSESEIATLEGGLAAVVRRWRSFEIRLRGGGTFPPKGPARVAFVDAEGGDALLGLQAAVAGFVVETLGREEESRRYHAHVTLARCRQPWKRYAVDRYLDLMEDFEARFRAEEIVLMASELGPGGARYAPVLQWPLATS